MLCDRGQSPAEPHEYINIYVIFTADIKKYKLMFTVLTPQWLQIFMNILGLSYQR